MSIKSSIIDGTGCELEATVENVGGKNNGLITSIGKIKSGVEFQVVSSTVGTLLDTYLKLDGTGTVEADVNGSSTPQDFKLLAPTAGSGLDLIIEYLGFVGLDGSIKLANFYAVSALSNGLAITGVSDETAFDLTPAATIKTTHDIEGFCYPGNFTMRAEAGNDSAVGFRQFDPTIIIREAGTFAADDYFQVRVQDNITAISQLRFAIRGKYVEAGTL